MLRHAAIAALLVVHVATLAVPPAKSVVVIGGGWAGFGAAQGIVAARAEFEARTGRPAPQVDVTLLDAAPRAGGLAAGWRSDKGKTVEAGMHGFWRSYTNIDALVDSLDLPASPFTEYSTSALHTKTGRNTVVAPILGRLPSLPAPLGPALLSRYSAALPLLDRLSAARLLAVFADFDGSDSAWRRYDDMTARDLFRDAGVSDALYEEFIEPLLAVLPMCPGEDCSAAGALSCFSYFALEHQGDFDVRWIRGSTTALIFDPWRARLEAAGVTVRNGVRVEAIVRAEDGAVQGVDTSEGFFRADGVVSAVGVRAAAFIGGGIDLPEFQRLESLRGVDVVAVRLWLRTKRTFEHAANVCGPGLAADLETTGFTYYHLNELQDEYAGAEVSVIEWDAYYASALLGLEDEPVLDCVLAALSRAEEESFTRADVDDFSIIRIRKGVTHFAPGTYQAMPKSPRSNGLPGWYWAGDWVARGEHRSWSQEKAYVTGLNAARAFLAGAEPGLAACAPVPLETEPDEPHIRAARDVARVARGVWDGRTQ